MSWPIRTVAAPGIALLSKRAIVLCVVTTIILPRSYEAVHAVSQKLFASEKGSINKSRSATRFK